MGQRGSTRLSSVNFLRRFVSTGKGASEAHSSLYNKLGFEFLAPSRRLPALCACR